LSIFLRIIDWDVGFFGVCVEWDTDDTDSLKRVDAIDKNKESVRADKEKTIN
jgi:hypothetical protein